MKAWTYLLLIAILLLITIAVAPLGCDHATGVASPSAGQVAGSTATGVRETTFDDLKFEMEESATFQRSMLTPEAEELVGRRIRIRGYIFPTLKKKGLKQFVLVRDNQECCFGPGAALYDCILVHMKEGKTAEFSIRPVAVEGTFLYEEFIDDYDGTIRAIYRLDGESVQ